MNFDKMSVAEVIRFLSMGRTSGKRLAFEFWLKNLNDVANSRSDLGNDQVHYTARLLTRFSLISTSESIFYFPTFTSLARIHDEFILNMEGQKTPEFMEIAGCQTLLLGGILSRCRQETL